MQISFLAAFLGGLLSLISPCSVMVIPTFAAAVAKERSSLFRMSLLFSLGLFTILVPLGLGAAAISSFVTWNRSTLSMLIGWLFVILGGLIVFGVSIPFPDFRTRFLSKQYVSNYYSIFVLGLVSGVGSSACVGPILGAIITLAAASTHPLYSFGLVLMYGLGVLLPLIGLVILHDKSRLGLMTWFQKQRFYIGNWEIQLTHLVSGLLLILIGYIFIAFEGSLGRMGIFSSTGLLDYFFDMQDALFAL